VKIQVAGEEVQLLPEKALYWPAEKLLALSDVHLGKPESLQAAGIPIPSGAHEEDLGRLRTLARRTEARRVYILGDLVHDKNSWTPQIQEALAAFFESQPQIAWTLLLGNHERGSRPFLEKLSLELVEGDRELGPFVFSHGHETGPRRDGAYTIQGHIHPVVRLSEGAIRLRLPCFVVDREVMTLPSFGILTGGYEISSARHRRLFAVTPETVFEVPSRR
jgi:DNA ligase-associated metallophosphoesterase